LDEEVSTKFYYEKNNERRGITTNNVMRMVGSMEEKAQFHIRRTNFSLTMTILVCDKLLLHSGMKWRTMDERRNQLLALLFYSTILYGKQESERVGERWAHWWSFRVGVKARQPGVKACMLNFHLYQKPHPYKH
jgi:hypothetical protein